MEGWIKLHRKFLKWEWFNISEMVHLFIYLLLNANNKEGKWRGTIIKRGQLVTGRKSLSLNTGISEQSIRTCIERLKSTSEITVKSTNKYSIITINKYEDYQIILSDTNQQINQQTNQQSTNNQPTTNHKQEYKKDNKEKKKELVKAKKSPDFIDQILDCFIQEHGNYEIINPGKERQMAGKILAIYKKKYPASTSEETLTALRNYFKSCINIQDRWLRDNMSLSIIVNKFNEINKILSNENKSTGATSDEELASIVAKHFSVG